MSTNAFNQGNDLANQQEFHGARSKWSMSKYQPDQYAPQRFDDLGEQKTHKRHSARIWKEDKRD
jgi:hypothetical protein